MAEGALRHLLEKGRPGKTKVISSGTSAASGFPATIYAVEATRTWDVDISGHQSQPLTSELIDKADLILAMTPSHYAGVLKCRRDAVGKSFLFLSYPDTSTDGEGLADPIGQGLDRYNETFLEIGERLGEILPHILKLIDGESDA